MVPIFEVKEEFSALRGLLGPVLSRAICLAVDSSRAITASLVFKSGFKARPGCLESLGCNPTYGSFNQSPTTLGAETRP